MEDIKGHERLRVPHGWGSLYLCALRDIVWADWAVISPYHFQPMQLWLAPPDLTVHTQRLIDVLASKLSELSSFITADVDQLCDDYVKRVSVIETVREVFAVETQDITTIWTIIDAPPFEDSIREPIYQAQLQILRVLKEPVSLDFYVLNVLELPKDEELSEVVPSNAELLWRR